MDGINLYNEFLALHKPQLKASQVPEIYWETLFQKLRNENIIRQSYMCPHEIQKYINRVEPKKATCPLFIFDEYCEVNDKNAIFLIDHIWQFQLNGVRHQLEKFDSLTQALCFIFGIDVNDKQRIDKILDDKLWKYCHAFKISYNGLMSGQRLPTWYVMNSAGSAIRHSDDPNSRVVPFMYLPTQKTYSLFFPIRDSVKGEIVTRDYLEFLPKNAKEREALMLPWFPKDFRDCSFVQVEPPEEYFIARNINDSCPTGKLLKREPVFVRNQVLRVYTENDVIRKYLTSPYFMIVDEKAGADILWLKHHFKLFGQLANNKPNTFINKFPYERVLTNKDLLSVICRRNAKEHHDVDTLETFPRWLPTTYNLKTELDKFISYYQQRANKGLDNHWIIKPFDSARGMDTYITNNINKIVRLPVIGPKIAQKYITRPVLFNRSDLKKKVKLEIRYITLLKKVQPLEVYVHRKFFVRLANKEFQLSDFDNYDRHFTVLNYLFSYQLSCEGFLRKWEEFRFDSNYTWAQHEDNICAMIREVFECAIKEPPPRGIGACQQSRALYACDIMLEWVKMESGPNRSQPKLLEIHSAPDCLRACKNYPNFFNEIFHLLFMDIIDNNSFRLL